MSGAVMPTGVICQTAQTDTSTPPAGWLFCDGSAQLRATFVGLFAVIGTTYGAGNGSTTFNIPDLRGRIMVTKDNSGGSAASRLVVSSNALNTSGGEETHVLTSGESGTTAHTHAPGGNTGAGSPHVHNRGSVSAGAAIDATAGSTYGLYTGDTPVNTGSESAHTHTIPTTAAASASSGSAHNNMMPFLTLNAIIKT